MKSKLYKQIDRIIDSNIKIFTKAVLDNAPEQFWLCPSSSSGKYHPPEDQGEGGLIRHLLKASEVAYNLANFYNFSEVERDIVFSATMIHDIQKNGIPWGDKTDYTHGLIAFNWLEQFSSLSSKSDIIRMCVRYHMGRWTQPQEEQHFALIPNQYELVVQLSDYMASRKSISFLPNIELRENIINYF